MAGKRVCGKCGAELTDVGTERLCPACLLEGGLDAGESSVDKPPWAVPGASCSAQETAVFHAFGDYELLEEIARGGMGVVYRARQVSLNRIVAVKVLLSGLLASPEFVKRFRAEAAAAASLQHPNIVAIHEVGFREGQHFFAMDYVLGSSLAELTRDRPLPGRRAAGYVKTVAGAIHYAHGRGILHRDLKPANVLIDENDQPRVTDFGLAKDLHKQMDLTLSGQVLGSPSYMSPEQAGAWRGKVGVRSDVYSLGAILYHLLTGRPPFAADTVAKTLHQVQNDEPPPPRLLNPSVPRDLETICLKCLEKEPDRRYAMAQELADELGRFLDRKPILARPEKFWRWCRRNPVIATLAAAAVFIFLLGFAGVTWEGQQARKARDLAQDRLYAAQMKLAVQAWDSGSLEHARQLLAAQRPAFGHRDLRGFEWRLLANLCREESLYTFPEDGRTGGRSGMTDWAVAFSPQGDTLAAAGDDGIIRLWDVATRRPVKNLTGHKDFVSCIAFSPDGRWFASGTGGLFSGNRPMELKLWDAKTWTVVGDLPGHSFWITSVAFSPDNQTLASASGDKSVRLWDIASRTLRAELLGHTEMVTCVAYSPDGNTLATASLDRTVRLWDAATALELSTLKGHTLGVWFVAFSPDGKTLASAGDDWTVRLWDVGTGRQTAALNNRSFVEAVAFTPNGRLLACGGMAAVTFWDVDTREEIERLRGFAGAVQSVAFSPDGETLATGCEFTTAQLWAGKPHSKVFQFTPHADGVMSAALSGDGKVLATGSGDFYQPLRPTEIKLWDLDSGHLLRVLAGHRGDVMSLAFSPDDTILASGSIDKTVRLWDVTSGEELAVFEGQTDEVFSVAISPDGRTLAAARGCNNTVALWDIPSRQPLAPLQGTALMQPVAFSPDGRLLAAGDFTGLIRVWDTANWREQRPLTHEAGQISALAFSPDGTRIAAGSTNKLIRLWSVRTGRELATLQGHQHVVQSIAFSPDGRTLASGGVDIACKLWNLVTFQEVAALTGHKEPIFTVTFSPDGNVLITASRDRTVRLWRALSFEQIETQSLGGSDGLRKEQTP
jgi:WD40 repeat protein